MKAILLEATGGPEALVARDWPEPEPGEGETLVEVRAAGINFADVLVRLDRYPRMPELPLVLGSEVAGEVDGTRVMGFTRGDYGGYAERAVVDRQWLFSLPEKATFAEGAAFLTAFLTAWIPLTELVRIGFGSRVLVTAAAGSVGTAAVQLVRALNGRPVAAVGSEEKLDLVRSLGADEAVTYERLEELDPVDCAFELVGGDVFTQAMTLVRPLGTTIAVGYAGGLWEDVSPQRLVGRNIGVHGFDLSRIMRLEPERAKQAARDVLRFWEGGFVRPVVGHEFSFEQAAEAHALIEERRSTGKVVLLP